MEQIQIGCGQNLVVYQFSQMRIVRTTVPRVIRVGYGPWMHLLDNNEKLFRLQGIDLHSLLWKIG